MNNEKTIVILFLLILNISCANVAYSLSANTSSPQSLQSLRETIIALDVTRTKTQQKVKELHVMQDMSLKKDIKEFSVFIEYLSYQIINYCQQIHKQFGSGAVEDLPCENQIDYSQSVDSAITTKEMKTSEEQVSALENELMNSLGDFDEMLLIEDEQLAQVSRKQTSGNLSNKGEYSKAKTASSGKDNKTAGADQENQGNGENQESQTAGQQQTENSKASKNSGSGKGRQKTTGKNQSRERRKLDEIDDDIVARQLKEAAEKESDPQLQEKLWDEYYRYKKKTLKQ